MASVIQFVVKFEKMQSQLSFSCNKAYSDFEQLIKNHFQLETCKIVGLVKKNLKASIDPNATLENQFLIKLPPLMNKIQIIGQAIGITKSLSEAIETSKIQFYKQEMEEEINYDETTASIQKTIADFKSSLVIESTLKQKHLLFIKKASKYAFYDQIDSLRCAWEPDLRSEINITRLVRCIKYGSSLKVLAYLFKNNCIRNLQICKLFKDSIELGDFNFISTVWNQYIIHHPFICIRLSAREKQKAQQIHKKVGKTTEDDDERENHEYEEEEEEEEEVKKELFMQSKGKSKEEEEQEKEPMQMLLKKEEKADLFLFECIENAVRCGHLRLLKWLWRITFENTQMEKKFTTITDPIEIFSLFWSDTDVQYSFGLAVARGFERIIKWLTTNTLTPPPTALIIAELQKAVAHGHVGITQDLYTKYNDHLSNTDLTSLAFRSIRFSHLTLFKMFKNERQKRKIPEFFAEEVFTEIDYDNLNVPMIDFWVQTYKPSSLILVTCLGDLLRAKKSDMAYFLFATFSYAFPRFVPKKHEKQQASSLSQSGFAPNEDDNIIDNDNDKGLPYQQITNVLTSSDLTKTEKKIGMETFVAILQHRVYQEQSAKHIIVAFASYVIDVPRVIQEVILDFFCGSDGSKTLLFERDLNAVRNAYSERQWQ